MLEQLRYGWASQGLEGPNQFQVIAASPAFMDLGGPLTRTALEFCRFDRPLEEPSAGPQVSFGWADRDGTRFIFYRSGESTDSFGRSGGVSAHVLADASSTTPIRTVARWSRASFWSPAQPDVVGLLPAITSEEIDASLPGDDAVDPRTSPEHRASFLSNVLMCLATRRPLAVLGNWGEVGELLGTLAEVLPDGALDGLCVSTYERGEAATQFDIVGVCSAQDVPDGYRLFDVHVTKAARRTHRLAEELLGGPGLSDAATAALNVATTERGRLRFRVFVATYEVLTSIQDGEEPQADTTVQLLSYAPTAALLVEAPSAQPVLARLALKGESGFLTALATSLDDASSAAHENVAQHLVDGCLALPPEDHRALSTLLVWSTAASPPFEATVRRELLRRLEADPVLVKKLDPAGLVWLLSGTHKTLGERVPEAVLDRAATSAPAATVGARSIEQEIRICIVQRALQAQTSREIVTGVLLAEGADLLRPLGSRLTGPQLSQLSEAVTAHPNRRRAGRALALVANGCENDHVRSEVLSAAVLLAPSHEVLGLVNAALDEWGRSTAINDDAVVRLVSSLRDELHNEFAQVDRPMRIDPRWEPCLWHFSHRAECARWLELLQLHAFPPYQLDLRNVARRLPAGTEADVMVAAELVIDIIARTVPSPWIATQASQWLTQVTGRDASWFVTELCGAWSRLGAADRRLSVTSIAYFALASLGDGHLTQRSGLRSTIEPELLRRLKALVAHLSDAVAQRLADDLPPGGRRWLRKLR